MNSIPAISLQVGGTVNSRRSLYIKRPEDDQLFQLLLAGEFCNILSSRQMGKSSLMIRTALRLAERGVKYVAIEVAGELGAAVDSERWYRGLLFKISRSLNLGINVKTWWEANSIGTPNQTLLHFFSKEVAERLRHPVVIFLDEIDSVLRLPFTDDLFTALRTIYNERPLVESYGLLTFCLLGVATPQELIKDPRATPYNVGQTLELRDFDLERDDLGPLANALSSDPDLRMEMLRRVLHWTGGHPYLTLKLCHVLQMASFTAPSEVDEHVEKNFSHLKRLVGDIHFQQILSFVSNRFSDGNSTFRLYERVLAGQLERVEASLLHAELLLSGLVKRNSQGFLIVRNGIYGKLFDHSWVRSVIVTEFDTAAWQGKNRLALLIGINDYRGEYLRPLRGCVADVEAMAGLLEQRFGFGVVSIKDLDATRETVIRAMQALLDAAGEMDQVLFYWSGHCSNLRSSDRYFATLVPSDSGRETWENNRDITSKELFAWVSRIEAKGTLPPVLIIDGGVGSRGLLRSSERVALRQAIGDVSQSMPHKNSFFPVYFDESRIGASGWLPDPGSCILLAACRAEELAREIEDSQTGLRRGLFSLHLQRSLSSTSPGKSWRDLLEEVSEAVTLAFPPQHPQFQGPIDDPVFEPLDLQPQAFLSVIRREGSEVTLDGGAAHGIGLRSVWSVYEAQDTLRKAKPIGWVRIKAVGATTSVGRVVQESTPGAIEPGKLASERSRAGADRYRIFLGPSVADDPDLDRLISRSPLLTRVGSSELPKADLFLHRLRPRDGDGAYDLLPELVHLERESWIFISPEGRQVMRPCPADPKGGYKRLLENLEALARHHYLRLLDPPEEDIAVSAGVEIEAYLIVKENEVGHPLQTEILPRNPELRPRERFAFKLKHHHPWPLEIAVIALGIHGTIDLVYPLRGRSKPWPAGSSLEIGFEPIEALEVYFPADYPLPGESPVSKVRESLLFLFSETPVKNLESLVERSSGSSSMLSFALQLARGRASSLDFSSDDEGRLEKWGLFRWSYFLQVSEGP